MALENKVALITGAASGIGLATAKVFLDEGVRKIALLDIIESFDYSMLCEEYPEVSIIYLKTDVSSEEQVRIAFQKTLKKFGDIDIVVNSAGILLDSEWRKEVAVNLNGTIIVTMAALDFMGKDRKGKGGTIVLISSESAIYQYPVLPIYTATKMGVLGLSLCFGNDFFVGHTGVKVMSMCPSATESGINQSATACLQTNYMTPELFEAIANVERQKAESVGKCIVEMIVDGESGSIWYSKNNLPGKKMRITVE